MNKEIDSYPYKVRHKGYYKAIILLNCTLKNFSQISNAL